ncbi:ABC transporter ATP-binding protein [Cytobacillus kochii]|uniref:ABC transporter ATP-binding protein n=1 Tax=Cytobacillus kochii TaxID=859143 RepID=UPI001CD6EA2B|nr:oligopeptide/dipeptide ABC transporter ATP-binding protein [Cytobacillus kochii]MCA1024511.1 ATP-binding cassette domain-containing protein [Cytobacillus kochii]MCM3323502.1 ATP-binding cassette domain-containing protein [Cytobacillus kochii]MCM3345897.1 ATP-binding cassette domain-containing protein [Cytobacillus kochii]
MTVILSVRGLKKYFDVTEGWWKKEKQYLKAVDHISFDVNHGETLGIVGESGCGKSTTGNLIMQLLEKTEGEIIFQGVDLSTLSKQQLRKKRAEMQMIFQDPFSSLNPRMKVFDIIAEPLLTHLNLSSEKLKEEVLSLMDQVGLDRSYIHRYPHEFSGGQRQRIGIARAIALQPKLIICDEPVSALDVSIQSQILNLMSKLQKELRLTFIFIAHGLPAVKYISDKIAVMYLGKIVELTTKEKLFSKPLHPYTEGLLSAVPLPDPMLRNKKDGVILEGDIPSPTNIPSGCRFHPRCPHAQEKCKNEEPTFIAHEEEHYVACHFPLKEGVGVLEK